MQKSVYDMGPIFCADTAEKIHLFIGISMSN